MSIYEQSTDEDEPQTKRRCLSFQPVFRAAIQILDERAQFPKRAALTGWDFFPMEHAIIQPGESRTIALGIAMEIPPYHFGLLTGRFTLNRRLLWIATGIIDSDYRGEICALVTNYGKEAQQVSRAEAIGMLVILPFSPVSIEDSDGPSIKIQEYCSAVVLPTKGTPDSAGWDLYPLKQEELLPGEWKSICLGYNVQIPKNYFGFVTGRSSWNKKRVTLTTGIVDSNDSRQVCVSLLNNSKDSITLPKEVAIGQMIILTCPPVRFETSDNLDKTEETVIPIQLDSAINFPFKNGSGWELFPLHSEILDPGESCTISLGMGLDIPQYFYGFLTCHQTNYKEKLYVCNGIIHPYDTEELSIFVVNKSEQTLYINPDTAIALLIISHYRPIEFYKGKVDMNTARGTGGFGSTNKNTNKKNIKGDTVL